jgi:hypothetical protein
MLDLIAEHPELLRRQRYACSLFEHRDELHGLAKQFDTHGGRKP